MGNDTSNCGSCEMVCEILQNAFATCSEGVSDFVCNAGFQKCGGRCVNVMDSDTSNCGSCDRVCPTTDHGTATCSMGVCSILCDSGYQSCGVDAATKCVLLTTDVNHCGGCNITCHKPPSFITTCESGLSRLRCAPRCANCDLLFSNGCETNVFGYENCCMGCDIATSTTRNCGTCGNYCGNVRNVN